MATWVWIALGLAVYAVLMVGVSRWLYQMSDRRDRQW